MIIGKVVSNVISTRKYEALQGLKFLVIQPCYGEKKEYFVAADTIGAGIGELVLVSFGEPVKYAFNKEMPVDAVVVGIVDSEPSINN